MFSALGERNCLRNVLEALVWKACTRLLEKFTLDIVINTVSGLKDICNGA